MVATPAVFISRSLFVDDYTLANERYQQSQHGQLQKSVDPCPLVSSAKIRFVQFLLSIFLINRNFCVEMYILHLHNKVW